MLWWVINLVDDKLASIETKSIIYQQFRRIPWSALTYEHFVVHSTRRAHERKRETRPAGNTISLKRTDPGNAFIRWKEEKYTSIAYVFLAQLSGIYHSF